MHETHRIDGLHVAIGFENLTVSAAEMADFEARLADFLRGPALQVVDSVFDAAIAPDESWPLEQLEIDLGRLVIEPGQDWEALWTRALREQLQRTLAHLREAPEVHTGNAAPRRPVRHAQARLEMLLYFLRHGHLPWHGRGRQADDPHQLAREVLRHDPQALAAALRHAPDRAQWLRRLASQFDGVWLAELVQALLPDDPSTVARLLGVMLRASRHGRNTGRHSAVRLWEATLNEALSHGDAARLPDIAVMRLELELALDADDTSLAQNDPLIGTETAWRRLLRDDRAWLKAALQRRGQSGPLERRLALALPTDLLADLASLWLAAEQSAAVDGWIRAVASRRPTSVAPVQRHHRELWQAALGHLWAGGGDANFDSRRFVREVRERTGWAAPSVADVGAPRDDPFDASAAFADNPAAPGSVANPSNERMPSNHDARALSTADALQADATWWARLRAQPDAMRRAIQLEVQRGDAACRQLAQVWTDEMLLEAACLPCPQARQLIAATVSSPPCDPLTCERRWAYTLRHLYALGTAGFSDEAYLEGLVCAQAQADGCRPEDSASRWQAAAQDPAAAAGWLERMLTVTAAPTSSANTTDARPIAVDQNLVAPGPAHPPMNGNAPQPSAPVNQAVMPAQAPTLAATSAAPPEAPPAEPIAVARSFTRKVASTLASIATTIGRRLGQLFGSKPEPQPAAVAPESSGPLHVDNAGLVLLGPYLPRLFDALGLTHQLSQGTSFIDDRHRERALYLMQFALNGEHAPAAESQLMLNKLFCGMPVEAPIERRFQPTPEECARVESLLEAVIAHWRVIGKTSISGLRETFLQRRGRLLRRDDGGWTLQVEPAPFDMLVDQLPWGYAMQKLPWMKEVLHVEWR